MLGNLGEFFAEPIAFLDQTLFRVLAVLIALCCHEWGHAFVAYRCGDDTAKRAGRLTLNPLAHLDPVGTLVMLFAGFGWAKPVPVNPYRFKGDRNKADLAVSLAGISVNLVLFIAFTLVAAVCSAFMWDRSVVDYYGLSTLLSYRMSVVWYVISGSAVDAFGPAVVIPWLMPIVRLCMYTALINLNLAVFNLLPLPPLDGYHVVNDLVFKGRFQLSRQAFQIAMVIVMVLAWQGWLGKIVSVSIYPLQDLLLRLVALVWG